MIDGFKYTFTVFTPTYNRAHTLHRVYTSLKAQTFRDFEWLIIDDGSVDNTGYLIEGWKKDADFPINYVRQENRGKHVALNRAFELALGELFIILDSDDECLPNSLERFKYHWESIPLSERDKFVAVTCHCKFQDGKLVGNLFPYDVTDSNAIEIHMRYKVFGEKWGFNRTELLRKYRYPEIEDINSVPESIIWSKLAKIYKTRFINEALRIYYHDTNLISQALGQVDVLNRKKIIYNGLKSESVINNTIDYFKYDPAKFFLEARLFSRYSFHLGEGIIAQYKRLGTGRTKLLWASMLPMGLALYLKDKVLNR